MRVAHICQSADPNIGGSLTVARALASAQREQGVDAQLFFLYGSDKVGGGAPHPECETFCDVDRHSRWLRGIPALRRALRQLNPQIIHHHDGILWPRLATAGLRRPLLTHGHLGWSPASPISSPYWTNRYIAAHTDCLLAISNWVRDSWVSGGFPSERIRLLPNGVDCGRFYPRPLELRRSVRAQLGLPMDQRLVLWAGRLDREMKGLDRLMATARALPAGIRMVIAGDGPFRDWLAMELETVPVDRRPLLLGKVADPAEIFGIADAFLFTSKVEPFGLVLLEAAASGLPIYAFDCEGGGQELLRELGALVVAELSVAELAHALAAGRPPVDATLIERVRRDYSWAAVARSSANVYAEFSPGRGKA